MQPKYVFDTTVFIYFARLKHFELLVRILEEMPAEILVPAAVRQELQHNLRELSNGGVLDYGYAAQVGEQVRALTEKGILHTPKLEVPDSVVHTFAAGIQRNLSRSSLKLSFDYGEACAIYLARQVSASAIFSDDGVVPFVINDVSPTIRVEGSPYLVKYGFLKKLINYSAFVRLLFDLQEKAGYRFLSLYDPRKRRIFEMYRDNILDGVHLVKYEIAECIREGRYEEIVTRLDGLGIERR